MTIAYFCLLEYAFISLLKSICLSPYGLNKKRKHIYIYIYIVITANAFFLIVLVAKIGPGGIFVKDGTTKHHKVGQGILSRVSVPVRQNHIVINGGWPQMR